MGRVGP